MMTEDKKTLPIGERCRGVITNWWSRYRPEFGVVQIQGCRSSIVVEVGETPDQRGLEVGTPISFLLERYHAPTGRPRFWPEETLIARDVRVLEPPSVPPAA